MTLIVPSSFPDRPPRSYSATVAANGTATIEIVTIGTYVWVVRQISLELASAPAGANCTVRWNGIFVSAAIATGDAVVEPPPLRIGPGDRATVVWTGCTPLTVATALVIYDEVAG